ncbi:MAG: GNAT family N-acetyltransferase [Desulfobulbaceae bacterium]|nr:GNAT family N-acetyltransferase [Desulfobulbaceae bacterium]
MPVNVRATHEHDFEAVYPLLQSLWQDKGLGREALLSVFKNVLVSPCDFSFVAEVNKGVTGFVAGVISNNFYHAGRVCYISTLVVNEAMRGSGIGTKLLNQVASYADSKKCAAIELDANFHREKSHAFYEHFGFAKRGYTFTLSSEQTRTINK